ncbi:response regulator [Neolewinella aurantiaca]|uniref:Response regulator n=1 Tax=Neolewinella aurantiaca TaxID=2602767 RepID=A0A5C7FA70_9BACT|nr:response regulator [Neolewinella aurantiaca]TXF86298.1 response regulator [Neolewinella aurantiaca]
MCDFNIVPEYPGKPGNHVLLVEKDPLQRYLLEVLLSEAEWVVRLAKDPEDALNCCEYDFFDAAIINSHYSEGQTGWALAKRFREDYNLPCLMITSSRVTELEELPDFTERQELLFKPYRLMECRRRLQELISQR